MWNLSKRIACIAIFVLWSRFIGVVPASPIEFGRDVQPILRQHCLKCHGPEKQKGGLRFDDREGAIRAGDSGETTLVPGNVETGELLRRVISSDESERMPPEGPALTTDEVDVLRRWIGEGATWPDDSSSPKSTPVRTEATVTDDDRRHWSFQTLGSIELPTNIDQNSNPVDYFVDSALTAVGIRPSNSAQPRTLIRRLYFDVVGLPPTPEEVEAFMKRVEPDRNAVAKLIDQLLASRHYGERWGRHWLDVARYADSNGWESDDDRPHAYQYRDFVIRALNDDLPFDTFVKWQLAGDEFEPDNPTAVAATGFLAAGPNTILNVPMEEEKLRNRYNELDDIVSTVGSGLLGLTVGCARCHDHKFDAIPARDYYQMMSAFHSGDRIEVLLGTRREVAEFHQKHNDWRNRLNAVESPLNAWLAEQRRTLEPDLRAAKISELPVSDEGKRQLREHFESKAAQQLAKEHEEELRVSDDEIRSAMNDDQQQELCELQTAVDEVRKALPPSPPQALAFRDFDSSRRDTWLFKRANFYDRGEPVELGFLTVLTSSSSAADFWSETHLAPPREDSTLQRKAFAEWIADIDHGAGALLARVIVNRIWQQHFGEGLVRTPSDLGVRGEKPTHPELLEWLASDFVRHGWKLKRLHRMILTSAAYLRDTQFSSDAAAIDPDNRLLWRRRPRRLEAEILRDAILTVSDTLNLEPFGPAFKPSIAAEAMQARNLTDPYPKDVDETPDTLRRSVYMFHKRVVPYPLLQAFDRPDLMQSCGRRDATTVAPQALALLNDRFIRDRSIDFAKRLAREKQRSTDRVILAYQLAFSRPPRDNEIDEGVRFLEERMISRSSRGDEDADSELLALADYCQVLFALNEFFFVD